MTLADYLRGNQRDLLPAVGTKGTETDWLPFCHLVVSTGSLWAGDPCIPNADDGCVFRVPIGTYVVEAKCMDFKRAKFVSRLRVRVQDAVNPVLGKEASEAGTDSGAIAVCDIQSLEAVIGDSAEAAWELIPKQVNEDYGIIELQFNGTARMPYVASGFGDGTGPVFEVRSKKKLIGMELEFISPDFTFECQDTVPTQDQPGKTAAFIPAGGCTQCGGSGKCYCIRKGSGTPVGCVRCNGSGKCHVCSGTGKVEWPPADWKKNLDRKEKPK